MEGEDAFLKNWINSLFVVEVEVEVEIEIPFYCVFP